MLFPIACKGDVPTDPETKAAIVLHETLSPVQSIDTCDKRYFVMSIVLQVNAIPVLHVFMTQINVEPSCDAMQSGCRSGCYRWWCEPKSSAPIYSIPLALLLFGGGVQYS